MTAAQTLSALLRSSTSGRVADVFTRLVRPRHGSLLVLTYHRVDARGSDDTLYDGLISASPEDFQSQMRWLARRYAVVSIDDVLATRRRAKPLPVGAVLLTFDDAYQDFAEHAWPVMRRLGVPATLFVPTGYPDAQGRSFWWDRLWAALAHADQWPARLGVGERVVHAGDSRHEMFRRIVGVLKTLPHREMLAECDRLVTQAAYHSPARNPVLSWSDIRTLVAEGVAIAPHSRTHPRLDRVELEALDAEVAGSVADLEARVGDFAPVFAYPDGAWSTAVVSAVVEAGLEMAFTTRRGGNVLGKDTRWYELRRINVGRRTNVNALAAQLALWSRQLVFPAGLSLP